MKNIKNAKPELDNKGIVPRIKKAHTLEEFIIFGLTGYFNKYSELNKEEKRKRDYSALNFIKNFCRKGKYKVKEFYRFYWRLKKGK